MIYKRLYWCMGLKDEQCQTLPTQARSIRDMLPKKNTTYTLDWTFYKHRITKSGRNLKKVTLHQNTEKQYVRHIIRQRGKQRGILEGMVEGKRRWGRLRVTCTYDIKAWKGNLNMKTWQERHSADIKFLFTICFVDFQAFGFTKFLYIRLYDIVYWTTYVNKPS